MEPPDEPGMFARLVSRCPSCYPPGAYDALKAWRNVPAKSLGSTPERTRENKQFP